MGCFNAFNSGKVTDFKSTYLNIHLIHRQKFSCWLGTASKDQLKLLPPAPCYIPQGMTGCAASVNIASAWTSRVEDAKRCRRRTGWYPQHSPYPDHKMQPRIRQMWGVLYDENVEYTKLFADLIKTAFYAAFSLFEQIKDGNR